MKKRNGFTLAEVLITLTIIGVIAALTIPNLLQKHQEHELITRLKKAHSVMSNAYAQAIRENGSPEDWDIGTGATAEGATKLYNYLKPYLKIQKECGNKKGCFAEKYKTLTGKDWEIKLDEWNNYAKVILEDGMSVIFYSNGSGCTTSAGTGIYSNICGTIEVDINGKKGPNKAGVDFFYFSASNNSILPAGGKGQTVSSKGNKCKYNDTTSKNGSLCTAWALYKGNMDYLRRDISTEWPWLK